MAAIRCCMARNDARAVGEDETNTEVAEYFSISPAPKAELRMALPAEVLATLLVSVALARTWARSRETMPRWYSSTYRNGYVWMVDRHPMLWRHFYESNETNPTSAMTAARRPRHPEVVRACRYPAKIVHVMKDHVSLGSQPQ